MVVESSQVEGCESVIFGQVHRAGGRQVGQDESHGTHVATQSSMVEDIEPVVVGNGDVCFTLHQQLYHIISLLGDGIMEGRVTL